MFMALRLHTGRPVQQINDTLNNYFQAQSIDTVRLRIMYFLAEMLLFVDNFSITRCNFFAQSCRRI